ncbi:MAG: hypothetical protein ACOCWH_02860, partial [Spirochaetota bacterium]
MPNTACRVETRRNLHRKGYGVVYESMIAMPSNWIVQTPEPLALRLLEVLPSNALRVAAEVLSGVRRRTRPLLVDRLLASAGKLERYGARIFRTDTPERRMPLWFLRNVHYWGYTFRKYRKGFFWEKKTKGLPLFDRPKSGGKSRRGDPGPPSFRVGYVHVPTR